MKECPNCGRIMRMEMEEKGCEECPPLTIYKCACGYMETAVLAKQDAKRRIGSSR